MEPFLIGPETVRSRVRTALGLEPADLLLRNCNVVNVLSLETYSADIAILGNRIVAVRKEVQVAARRVIGCDGLFAVPGFINPNCDASEIEVSPADRARSLVPNGITTLLTIREIPAGRDDKDETRWKMDLSENHLRQVIVEEDAALRVNERVPQDRPQGVEQLRTGARLFLDLIQDPESFFAEIVQNQVNTSSICFRSDCLTPSPELSQENNPFWLQIQSALKADLPPAQVFQMAGFNAAAYYGMDHLLGSISPNRLADLVLLTALDQFPPAMVVVDGKIAARDGLPLWGTN
jgi:adenine deaminase